MNNVEPSRRYKKILLIDDDEIDRFISNRIIKSSFIADEVIIKSSAAEGLGYLKSLSETHEELPEIILLDLEMPVMDGFDFLEEFRMLGNDIRTHCKIVALTNGIKPSHVHKLKSMFSNQSIKLINKPLTVEALNIF